MLTSTALNGCNGLGRRQGYNIFYSSYYRLKSDYLNGTGRRETN